MRQLPSLSQPIIRVVLIMPVTILLRLLAKPVHFTIRKSAKVRNACEPTIPKNSFISQLQPQTDLTFFFKQVTIKVRSLVLFDSQFSGCQTHFFIKLSMIDANVANLVLNFQLEYNHWL